MPVRPVLRLMAVTAGQLEAIEWSAANSESVWGPIALRSDLFDFNQTDYYRREMGENLKKQFFAFARLADPDSLAADKLLSNQWETQYADMAQHAVARPVNIDPGYLTEAKLVLGSTKDRDHRIYLHSGVYAEITLYFHQRQWKTSRWTYPDFQQPSYFEFFNRCRDFLRQRLTETAPQ